MSKTEKEKAMDGYEASQRIYGALFDLGLEFIEAQHAFEQLADAVVGHVPYETAAVMQGYTRCGEEQIDDLLRMEFICPDCSLDPCECYV